MTVGIKPDVAFAAQTVHGRWMSKEYEPGLVSIIIPTYNRAHVVTEAMDSVWQQTYRPIELIVVDDGSTDNSQQVVEHWGGAHVGDAHFKLRYVRQENRGVSAARNLGLIESWGESIQFLDSDDLLGRTKTSLHVAYFRNEMRCGAVYGKWRSFRESSPGWGVVSPASTQYNGDTLLASWIEGSFIPLNAILWRRKVVVELGPWDEKAFCNNDGEYACRFMISGGVFGWCPEGWSYYRRGEDDHISHTISRRSAEAWFRVAERLVAELTARNMLSLQLRKSMARHYFRIARATVGVHNKIAFECFMRIKRLGAAHPARVMMYASGARGAMLITIVLMSILRNWRKLRGMKPRKGEGRVGSLDELIRLDTVSGL